MRELRCIFPNTGHPGGKGKQMDNFVLVGKAKTVFRLIALKAQQEELAKLKKKYQKGKKR
jgi:hypothetical protein